MYMSGIKMREIDVTVLMDTSASMYNPAMSEVPDVPEDLAINKARNQLAEIIEKARYYDGVTFLTNRGKRVAAIVPVEVGERYLAENASDDS